ncbi:MAG: metal ABC transporter substrate-binding protein [Acidimicrobiales bacterium]
MRTEPALHTSRRRTAWAGALFALAAVATGCGSDDPSTSAGTGSSESSGSTGDTPVVSVTYSILGDVVQRLVGDDAVVQVVIPNGQDPHEFSPSARDVESMRDAELIVANGLGLEEGLADALDEAADDGVPVFHVTDHVTLRALDPDDPEFDDHQGKDPHVWTDPLLMKEMAPALVDQLEQVLGVQLDDRLAAFEADMDSLDGQVRQILSALPAGDCRLVTGHESLGYFAERYGCEVIGAVIPSLSSTAEASAKDLADLARAAEDAGVAAIFTEVGTPAQVAEQVADEVGVPLVELPSHKLPDTGGYDAFVTDLATGIANALAG